MKRFLFLSVFIACWGFCVNTFAGNYYPLETGYTWLYQFSASGTLDTVTGERTIENLPRRKLDTKEVTPQKVEVKRDGAGQPSFVFLTEDETGVYEVARQRADDIDPTVYKKPVCRIRYPAEVGTEWKAPVKITLLELVESEVQATFSVEKRDEVVTVPAGTFENCLRVKAVAETRENLGLAFGTASIQVEHHLWYAPHVGLVKHIVSEKSNHRMVGSGKLTVQLMRSGKNRKTLQK